MAWGQPGVTTKLLLSNATTPWGAGGQPIAIAIQRGDILRDLLVQTRASQTNTPGTGSISTDPLGPYNTYARVDLGPANAAKIVNVTGYGLYLIDLIRASEDFGSAYDGVTLPIQNPASVADVQSYSSTASNLLFYVRVPVSQYLRSLSYEIGLWQLSQPTMNMILNMVPNTASTGSPYNVYSTTPGQAPFLITGNATVTVSNPIIDTLRRLYKNPARPEDYPPIDFISVWTEDIFQNSLTLTPSFIFPANSGLLARAIVFAFDGTAGNGAAIPTYFSNPTAIQLLYSTSDVKISISGYEQRMLELQAYSYLPPRGVFFFNFLGSELTLEDVLDTSRLLNIRFQLNLSTALPANSYIKCIYQLLQPVVAAM